MPSAPRRKPWLTLAAFLLMVAWPVWVMLLDAWMMAHQVETISEFTLAMARNAPLIPCVIGLLIGGLATHLFFPQVIVVEVQPSQPSEVKP